MATRSEKTEVKRLSLDVSCCTRVGFQAQFTTHSSCDAGMSRLVRSRERGVKENACPD
jgi:hypothetical protein